MCSAIEWCSSGDQWLCLKRELYFCHCCGTASALPNTHHSELSSHRSINGRINVTMVMHIYIQACDYLMDIAVLIKFEYPYQCATVFTAIEGLSPHKGLVIIKR